MNILNLTVLHIESILGTWNDGLFYACKQGNKDLALYAINKGANNLNHGLCGACEGGHIDTVFLMMEKGANNWNCGLDGACKGGHMNLVLLMIELGANAWNVGLWASIRADITLLMIQKGANDLDRALWCAYDRDIVLLLIEMGANINKALYLDRHDIEYLVTSNKVKNYGEYTNKAKIIKEKRVFASRILKELNLRDVDALIMSF